MSRENNDERRLKIPFRLPEFHGDPDKYPEETWAQYKMNMDLAYRVAGINEDYLTDEQKAAHLLQGLQGKARKFLEYSPGLHKKKLADIKSALEEKFGRQGYTGLINISSIRQKPDELVIEYLARLRSAAEGLLSSVKNVTVVTEEELDDMMRTDPHLDRTMIKTEQEYQAKLENFEESREALIQPHFIEGLRDDIKTNVDSKQPQTLAAAVKAAEDYEKYMYQYGRYGKRRIAIANALEQEDIIDSAAKQLQDLNISSRTGRTERRKYNQEETQERQRQDKTERAAIGTCHFCGKLGHYQRECRLRKARNGQDTNDKGRTDWQNTAKQYNRYPKRDNFYINNNWHKQSNWRPRNRENWQRGYNYKQNYSWENRYKQERPYEYNRSWNSHLQRRVPDMFLRGSERDSARKYQQPGESKNSNKQYHTNKRQESDEKYQRAKNESSPPRWRGGYQIPPSFQVRDRQRKW
jgi:hypothetical protein